MERTRDDDRGIDDRAETHEEEEGGRQTAASNDGEKEGRQETLITLTPAQLDELVTRAAATAVEAAFEQERLAGRKVKEPDSIRYVPRVGPVRKQGGLTHYDPETDEEFDPFVRAHMWRPDRIDSCHCGQVKFARIMQKVGERDIRDAQRPIVDPSSGRVLAQPHRFVVDPVDGSEILPAELFLTDEKRAHLLECKKAHYVGLGIAAQVADKVANPDAQPHSTFNPSAGQELAAQAHLAAAGHDVG